MIYRITPNEWLKRVDNMTKAEMQELANRVGEWLRRGAKTLLPKAEEPLARMMSVEQVSTGWTTEAQDAFNEGVRLLSPFAFTTDTWLPDMIYTKAAKRSIYRIVDILKHNLPKLVALPEPEQGAAPTPRAHNHKDAKPHNCKTAQLQSIANESVAIVPRPKHIDQYIHLLPEGTQKRAQSYGQLVQDLGTARGNMRLLLEDSKATTAERERWAKTAVALDQKIGDLRKELDAEWNKLATSQRVTVDVFGIAHILGENEKTTSHETKIKVKNEENSEKHPKPHKKEHISRKQYSEDEKNARIKYLQKWLRDPRPAATPEHKKRWQEYAKELKELGGELTKSIEKAADHYKVKMPR